MRRPLLEERARLLLRRERRRFGEVRLGREAEAARPAVLLRRGIDGLQMLALVGRHAGAREAAHLRVRGEQPREQSRAAPVQAGEEDEAMLLHGGAIVVSAAAQNGRVG